MRPFKNPKRHHAGEVTRVALGSIQNARTYFEDAEYAAGDIGDEQARAHVQAAEAYLTMVEDQLERALYFLADDAPIRTNQKPPELPEYTPSPKRDDGAF